jgi:hypothetical protein
MWPARIGDPGSRRSSRLLCTRTSISIVPNKTRNVESRNCHGVVCCNNGACCNSEQPIAAMLNQSTSSRRLSACIVKRCPCTTAVTAERTFLNPNRHRSGALAGPASYCGRRRVRCRSKTPREAWHTLRSSSQLRTSRVSLDGCRKAGLRSVRESGTPGARNAAQSGLAWSSRVKVSRWSGRAPLDFSAAGSSRRRALPATAG